MSREEAKEVALITSIIINEDILGGTVFQTFDYAYRLANQFYKKNKDINWEHSEGDFDEAIIIFVRKKIKEREQIQFNQWNNMF